MRTKFASDLHRQVLDHMGRDSLDLPKGTKSTKSKPGKTQTGSRKTERKAERERKRGNIYGRNPTNPLGPFHSNGIAKPSQKRKLNNSNASGKKIIQPTSKSSSTIPKRQAPAIVERDIFDESDQSDEIDLIGDDDDGNEEDDLMDLDEPDEDDLGSGSDIFDDDDEDDASENGASKGKSGGKLSKAVQDRFAADDAEIEEYERKLGIKKGRRSLPKAFQEDGLGDLLGDEADGADSDDEEDEAEQKREYDQWLASKRKTANATQTNGDDNGESDDEFDKLDSDNDDEFGGFDEDDEDGEPAAPKKRENPYEAPKENRVVAKYVPPSLRNKANGVSEERQRLQRNIQGLINRLTETNILSIVQSMEDLYQKNARGDVTEIITDVLMAQICKGEILPDQFFVLNGGFTAAIYKIIGASFGSHVLHRLESEISRLCKDAEQAPDEAFHTRKEVSNLVSFLTQLYVFEALNCKLIFDYMEFFLSDLTELNVEMLLKICRMAGRMLRRDDPRALKHITSVLNANLSKYEPGAVSVRTKFMVETINDLKDNKTKAKGVDSVMVSEHVLTMKKRIGELKSQSRRLDGLAPMGVSLEDLQNTDTLGKWWLVGASVPVKPSANGKSGSSANAKTDLSDDEDMDFVLPDYSQKARAQGFSSLAQVAIFTALMSASNYEQGYRQYVDLKLKKDDQLEIARVIVQCVGSETQYNDYYALVAKQACTNSRLRFAFQDRLWKMFRSLGESLFGDEAEFEETADTERMRDKRRLEQVAQFYATLIADNSLTLAILKPLELRDLSELASRFVEALLVSLLRSIKGKGDDEDARVEAVFGAARDVPAVAAGVHWFLRKKVRGTDLVSGAVAKKIDRRRRKAQAVVQLAADV